MTTKTKSLSVLSRIVLGAVLAGAPATAAFASEVEVTTAASADAMAQHYREQAEHYKALGGVAYKSGLVQRAEADAAKYAALAGQLRAPAVAEPRSAEAEHYAQLAAQYRAIGGPAYKSGRVQWAEAQQRKYEVTTTSAAAETTPAPACAVTKPAVAARLLACSK